MSSPTIVIHAVDGSIKIEALIEEKSVRHFELMKDDYVKLVFKTNKNIHLELGDYINCEWGAFEITKIQKPKFNYDTGGYEYEIQFNATYYKFNNKLYKFNPSTSRNETTWSLTDCLKNHMSVLVRNLSFYGWAYTYVIDDTVTNKDNNIYISFDNSYILDSLQKIADSFDCEYWITDNIIHLGRVSVGTPVDFEIGDNVFSMSASSSSEQYITRLYAFGSTKNIPSGYRKSDEQVLLNGVVQKRLMLPSGTPYIDVEGVKNTEQVVEGIITFDDIYPRMVNAITSVEVVQKTVDSTDTIEASADSDSSGIGISTTKTVNIYRFKDSSLTFSKDYILPDVQLQVQFQSGTLSGMIFDVAFNPEGENENTTDSDGNVITNINAQLFEIVINNTYGLDLPNDTLRPSKDDSFILIGWNTDKMSSLGLVSKAEKELLDRSTGYAAKLSIDPCTYTCVMHDDFMYGLDEDGKQNVNFSKVGTYPLGQKIKLINPNYFSGGYRVSRVVGFEYKLDVPYDAAQIIVGDSSTYSLRNDLQASINGSSDSINYRGNDYKSSGTGSNVYIITTNDVTPPSDSNVYSSLKSKMNFLSKLTDDQAAGLITFLKGLHTGNFKANESGGSIDAEGKGELEDLVIRGIATIKNLTVTGAAHFFKLVIDEIKSAAGAWIITAADGFKADIVTNNTTDNTYTLYWKATDGEKSITNMWEIGDRAICQTFNAATGTTYEASNKLWWAHVSGKGSGKFTSDGTADETNGERYNYITLNWNLKSENTNGVPAVGDEVSQLGHMLVGGQDYEKDTDGKDILTSPKDEAIRRQSAIYISSYNSIDTGLTAPLEAFYQGIDDFSLESHRKTYKDANGAVFVGKRFEIELNSGSTIRVPADRGAWTTGTTCYYYDRVSHGGSLWLCVTADETGTADEPADGNANWEKQVAAGEKGESGSGVNLDLTNENDSVIYIDGTGKTIGLPLTTYAYLYDGASAQKTNIEYSTVASNCTASKITVATNGKATLTVTAVSADIAYVDVNCVYKNVTYTKRFNIKRLHGTDKYELITNVNSVSYNPATGTRSADEIAISIYRTGQTDGTRTLIALANLPTGYGVYYKKSTSDTTVGPLEADSVSISEMTSGNVMLSIKDATNGNVLDSETVPIVSDGKNGDNGTSVTITKTEVTYCADSQGTTAPATGWSATIPAVTAGQFLWTKTVVTYSDGNRTTSYTVSKAGEDGTDGITLVLSPTTLEFDTGDDGIATGTKTCYVTYLQGSSTAALPTSITVNAYSGLKAAPTVNSTAMTIAIPYSLISTQTVSGKTISVGSGYVDFTARCNGSDIKGDRKSVV